MLVAKFRDSLQLMMKIREKVWPYMAFYTALNGLYYKHHVIPTEPRYVYQSDTFQGPVVLIPYLKLKCWKFY